MNEIANLQADVIALQMMVALLLADASHNQRSPATWLDVGETQLSSAFDKLIASIPENQEAREVAERCRVVFQETVRRAAAVAAGKDMI